MKIAPEIIFIGLLVLFFLGLTIGVYGGQENVAVDICKKDGYISGKYNRELGIFCKVQATGDSPEKWIILDFSGEEN